MALQGRQFSTFRVNYGNFLSPWQLSAMHFVNFCLCLNSWTAPKLNAKLKGQQKTLLAWLCIHAMFLQGRKKSSYLHVSFLRSAHSSHTIIASATAFDGPVTHLICHPFSQGLAKKKELSVGRWFGDGGSAPGRQDPKNKNVQTADGERWRKRKRETISCNTLSSRWCQPWKAGPAATATRSLGSGHRTLRSHDKSRYPASICVFLHAGITGISGCPVMPRHTKQHHHTASVFCIDYLASRSKSDVAKRGHGDAHSLSAFPMPGSRYLSHHFASHYASGLSPQMSTG